MNTSSMNTSFLLLVFLCFLPNAICYRPPASCTSPPAAPRTPSTTPPRALLQPLLKLPPLLPALSLSLCLLSSPPAAPAAPNPDPITACAVTEKNCASSRNVKQIGLYKPPWTYEGEAGEAWARLKGGLESNPKIHVTEVDNENFTLQFSADRNFGTQDEGAFKLLPADSVVTFVSRETDREAALPDLGAQKARLDDIRRAAGFGEMGSDRGSADTAGKKETAGSQLKAFYGLQSGEGYEEVLEN